MDDQKLQQLLAHEDWRAQFEPSMLHRGLAIMRAGDVRVLGHEITGNGDDLLLGMVGRSATSPYFCDVVVHEHGDDVTIRFTCSCQRQTPCEHLAALLTFVSVFPASAWGRVGARGAPARRGDDLPQWDRWLQQLSEPQQRPQAVREPREFGVLLRARAGLSPYPADCVGAPGTSRPPDLLAAPVWLRRGKRGDALVDPQGMQLIAAGAEPAPPEGWPDDTMAALTHLLRDANVPHGTLRLCRIAARHHEHALEHLLARYPVYFEKASAGALQRGPERTLRLFWHDLRDGSQCLNAGMAPGEHGVLLQGAGMWYVDPEAHCYGRVQGDDRLLRALANAPRLQPEQVEAFAAHSARIAPAAALPPPNPRAPVCIVEAPPDPVLLMRRVRNWPTGYGQQGRRSTVEIGCARCFLDYRGVRVSPLDTDPAPRRLIDGVVYQASRDMTAERAAIDVLLAAGLVQALDVADGDVWGTNLVDDSDLVLKPAARKPPLSPEGWQPVLRQLREVGFRIEYEDDFPRDDLVHTGEWHAELGEDGSGWFDLRLGIDVGDQRLDLLPILRRLLEDPDFPLRPFPGEKPDATWRIRIDDLRSADLPLARLRELIEPLLEWLQSEHGGHLRLHRTQAENLARLAGRGTLVWRGDHILRERIEALRVAARTSVQTPHDFAAPLRPYQCEGLAWLDFLADSGLGGVLADDMGLGKTVQVLAHLLSEKQRGRLQQPALVVCPTSLVGNWRDEAARFAPSLRVLVIHGAGRADAYDEIAAHDLIITTYPLLPRDRERLIAQQFSVLIVDEAQAIKNARSQAAQVVREIPARRRLAMTGTPLENHLGELWAQFDAIEPGLLGSERQFTRLYRNPIEKQGDAERQQRLNQRIGTLLLRRRKEDVLSDLPPKTEIVRRIELEGDQRSLYEGLRLAQHARVQEAMRERGLNQSGIIVLDALLKLRQVCCDPALVKLASAGKVKTSAKREALHELLEGLLAEGRKVLLFSQFTEMLGLLAADLDARQTPYLMLTGDTPGGVRAAMVKRFQQGEVPLFLISLKAGGVGLNLTAADTVVHYDPWWNPAAETQATDRAHRIGQDKPVFVYKLICTGTVEEKIQALQARKSDLARAVLEGGSSQRLRFDEADMAELFAPLD
ncbi:MAG: DEAD/DEAH box helicase [Xanthomonadaceae bacterium]|nr:DEAD/DEAH box helicase [Xanthomonadaceae bacterium]